MDERTETSQIDRLLRLYGASLAIHRELLQLRDEASLFRRACEIAVDVGKFRLAWLGAFDAVRGRIVPITHAGDAGAYTDGLEITVDDSELGRGPTGSALREGRYFVCTDIELDPCMEPWRERARRCGLRSSGAFPIHRGGRPFGALSVYSGEPGFIDTREIDLLLSIAEDLGHALDGIDRAREKEAADAKVRASEERYRTLVELASDGIFLAGSDHRYLDVNPAGCAMLGYRREELIGMHLHDVIDPQQLKERPVSLAGVAPWVSFFAERRLRRKDGQIVEAEIHGVMLPDGRLQSVVRDITARKRAEAERMAMDRMASLGRLAQGIAHEINNPLAYTSLNLELVALSIEANRIDDSVRKAVASAQEGTVRIASVVRTLSAFGRGESETIGPTELTRAIDGAVALTAHRVRHLAPVELSLTPDVHVHANEFRLGQVFVNLLLNAADAIQEVRRDAHRILVRSHRSGDGRAVVEVEDTGPGIPADALPRIFEPFFSTKPYGRGTGIGLAIARDIVASFGGTLEAGNVPGGGARFTVTLREAPPSSSQRARPTVRPSARRLRVLVVDDEERVGRGLAQGLAEHDVTFTTTVDEAQALCREREFDCIVCDLMLPERGGDAFYAALCEERPALARRVVFMTGGVVDRAAAELVARGERPILEKPFSLETLREAIDLVARAASAT